MAVGSYNFPRIVAFENNPPVLLCTGDEDRTTQGLRRPAFVCALRAQTDVIVDLSGLVFADTSLMLDLALLSNRLRRGGRKLLLRGAPPKIARMIEIVGLHRLPGVRLDEPAPALT